MQTQLFENKCELCKRYMAMYSSPICGRGFSWMTRATRILQLKIQAVGTRNLPWKQMCQCDFYHIIHQNLINKYKTHGDIAKYQNCFLAWKGEFLLPLICKHNVGKKVTCVKRKMEEKYKMFLLVRFTNTSPFSRM